MQVRVLVDLLSERFECHAGALYVQRLVLIGSEDLGEQVRLHAAQEHVRVGHRERTTLAVAHRAWVSTRTLRAHHKQAVLVKQTRSTSGRDGVDVQLRGLDGHSSRGGFEHMLVGTGIARHICGRATHVEANHRERRQGDIRASSALSGGVVQLASDSITHHTTCRARQNGLVSQEVSHGCEASVGLHETDVDLRHACIEALREGLQVALDHRSQVSIHAGGSSSGHGANHRHDFRGDTDLLKTQLGGDVLHDDLMVRESVTVQKHNRQTLDAQGKNTTKLCGDLLDINGLLNHKRFMRLSNPDIFGLKLIFGVVLHKNHSLVDFDDFFVQKIRALNLQVKDLGATLVANQLQVAEA
mmetsp:Transcript_38687/g.66887  ORF Transcript_38687/g.66887 Transcript_38687/m.66887 type:complete len:357 (-) Transcript_38687:348-1418(-)